MSVKAKTMSRTVDVDQYLDIDGTIFFWNKIKTYIDEHVPDVTANDPNLSYGTIFSATDWDSLPEKNADKQVLSTYIVGRLPTVGSNILGFCRLTDGTNHIVYWKVTSLPTLPVERLSVIGLQFLDSWKIGETTWDDIADKPDLVTETQMNDAINSAVSSVYRYAGSVSTYANLPTENVSSGDVYNVIDTDMNYAWVKTEAGGYWDPLGSTFSIEPIPNSTIEAIVDGTYGS